MTGNHWTIGIDFGTSNTAAAHTNPLKGTVEAVSLSHDRTTMSSSVYVESPEQIEVGEVAFNKAETNPAGFIAAPKRVIPQQTFQINGYDISASKPVAAVLSSVVRRVSREHGNVQPSELVLTHPEAWSSNEINVLLEAAKQLGLSAAKITTISEPQAAAHYYSQAKNLAAGERIAVFDFGGGTLDVAVLEASADGSFSVIAARGDNALGGKNFDALIRRWVDEQLEDRNPELLEYFRNEAPLQERHALEDSIRRAKELLSEASYATVAVTGRGGTERFQITRGEFEALIAPTLEKAAELTKLTLADANITSSDQLVALYLTGGSSRIPVVQEKLKYFGPIATLDDPKTVVAQGAISAVGPILRNMTPQNMGADIPTMAQSTVNTNYTAPPTTSWAPNSSATTGYGNYSANSMSWQPTAAQYPSSSAVDQSQAATNFTPATTSWTANPSSSAPNNFVATPTLQATTPPATVSKKSNVKLYISLIAAVVVFMVGRYIIVTIGEDSPTEPTETTVETVDEAAETQAPTPEPTTGPESTDTYKNMPVNLRNTLGSCEEDYQADTGDMWLECEMDISSEDDKYFYKFSDVSKPTINVLVDPEKAQQQRESIANGDFDTFDNITIKENQQKTTAAQFSQVASTGYTLIYASTENDVVMHINFVKDAISGENFLKSKGLL